MSNVLVIGGSGNLGRKISEYLSKFFDVIIFDRNKTTNIKTICFDILDKERFEKEFSNYQFSAVIHLVGSKTIDDAEKDRDYTKKLNLDSLKIVIESCEKNKTPLIFLSSSAVYGKQKCPLSEEAKPSPMNFYGHIKNECENIIKKAEKERNLQFIILRVFTVYNGRGGHLLIGKLFGALEKGEFIRVQNLDQKRDFIVIDDLCEVIRRSIGNKGAKNQIINVGSGIGHSMREIVDLFRKNTDIKIEEIEGNGGYDVVADISKMKSILNMKPEDFLSDLIREIKNDK